MPDCECATPSNLLRVEGVSIYPERSILIQFSDIDCLGVLRGRGADVTFGYIANTDGGIKVYAMVEDKCVFWFQSIEDEYYYHFVVLDTHDNTYIITQETDRIAFGVLNSIFRQIERSISRQRSH